MSNKKDWIPEPIAEFKAFGDNFCSEVTTNHIAWGLDATDSSELIVEQTTFNTDYAISSVKNKHTSLDTQATNDARAPYEARIRKIGIPMKTSGKMTDVERTACGVVNDSDAHVMSPIALVSPPVQFERTGELALELAFGIPTAGKPVGQEGVSVVFGFYPVGGTPPAEANCTKTVLIKKKKGGVIFSDANMGMAFVGFARYFNTRLDVGRVATRFTGIVS